MQISIDIAEDQLSALDALAKRQSKSRDSIIREVIDDYLRREGSQQVNATAFGLWRDHEDQTDDLLTRLREEW